MRIKVKNLGPMKQAEFVPGDFTIICGGNNTGKTYTTYTLYAFLEIWRFLLRASLLEDERDSLLKNGVAYINLEPHQKNAQEWLDIACNSYTQKLPQLLAANPDHFRGSEFHVSLDHDVPLDGAYDQRFQAPLAELLSVTKKKDDKNLIVSLLVDPKSPTIPMEVIDGIIGSAIAEVLFGDYFPKPFIASAERTGTAVFRRELQLPRNRLAKEISRTDKKPDLQDFVREAFLDYALPVSMNINFSHQLESVAKTTSFLADNHPDVLQEFADLVGGEYSISQENVLYFEPKGKQTVRLTMDESSSSVRSMLGIGYYLRHRVQKGDLLMIDEPELNLHPENQRRLVRLLARLVNLGVKVFLTTHSDYLVKELNTLIMLNHEKPYLKKIAEREGYNRQELLSSERVRVYTAKEDLVKLDGNAKRNRCQTLVEADIDAEWGIEAPSFDETIDTMNRIQEMILWGGDE